MPKGVYPRRKVGRPAKAAPKPEPKPLNIREQFTTLYDFLISDPEYRRINELHADSLKAAGSVQSEIRTETYKVQRLLIARDLVIQATSFDVDFDGSADELLKASTGNDTEMWDGMLSTAAEDLTDLITDTCCAIATLAKQRDDQSAKSKELITALNARRDVLRDQWWDAPEPKSSTAD